MTTARSRISAFLAALRRRFRRQRDGAARYSAADLALIKYEAHDRYVPCSPAYLPRNAETHTFVTDLLSRGDLVASPGEWLEAELREAARDPERYTAETFGFKPFRPRT